MEDLRIVGIVGGTIFLWATLFTTALYFSSRIKQDYLRIVAKSGVWAVFLSPGVAFGHGCAPAPTIVVVFFPGHLWIGLLEMAICFAVFVTIGIHVRLRRKREQ